MRTILARLTARVVVPLAAVLATVLLLRAHDALGGGLLAATVLSVAVVFRQIAVGAVSEAIVGIGAARATSAGLLLMLGTGFAGYAWGHGFLGTATAHLALPLIGTIGLHSTLLFELGMAITVSGVAISVIQALGDER